jgi:hypothetical protein
VTDIVKALWSMQGEGRRAPAVKKGKAPQTSNSAGGSTSRKRKRKDADEGKDNAPVGRRSSRAKSVLFLYFLGNVLTWFSGSANLGD